MKTGIIVTAIASLMIVSCNKDKKDGTATSTTMNSSVNEDAIRSEIQKLEDGYAASMNAKQTDGLMAYYADDAQSYLTGKSMVSGKTAIIEAAKEDFSKLPDEGKIEYTMTDLFISNDGEQVVEVGSYRASDKSGALRRKGNFMATFAKRDGKYVCIRDIDSPQ